MKISLHFSMFSSLNELSKSSWSSSSECSCTNVSYLKKKQKGFGRKNHYKNNAVWIHAFIILFENNDKRISWQSMGGRQTSECGLALSNHVSTDLLKQSFKNKHTSWDGKLNSDIQGLGGQLAKASKEHEIHCKKQWHLHRRIPNSLQK